jgi:hypothetical protein
MRKRCTTHWIRIELQCGKAGAELQFGKVAAELQVGKVGVVEEQGRELPGIGVPGRVTALAARVLELVMTGYEAKSEVLGGETPGGGAEMGFSPDLFVKQKEAHQGLFSIYY